MMRKGFTIVELMMVVGIIAILLGIVTTAASQSIKAGRERQAEALCTVVQSGLAAYHAQNDEWPDPLAGKVRNGSFGGMNDEGVDGNTDADKYVLQPGEVRQMVKALVDEAKKGNPLMDISALFVSRYPGERGEKGFGLDFMSAVRGTPKSKKKMTTSEMYFGYPDKETGKFRRFKMIYSIPTDQLTVSRQ